jgi:glycosyltransferase involved in cell wall biosynthesis
MTKNYTKKEKQMESSNEYLLTICICTLPSRDMMFNSLVRNLSRQVSDSNLYDDVELISDADIHKTIGQKRNDLLDLANGKFIVFIDDDDSVSGDYLKQIINVIRKNNDCDCIGMKGVITFDGNEEKKWEISKDFGKWFESNGVYYRTPNHISPIRTSIAKSVGFPNISNGEDFEYSMGVLPLLKNEVKIEKELYHYQYVTRK